MEEHLVSQNYHSYRSEDHETWATLNKMQVKLRQGRVSSVYLEGLKKLQLDERKIIRIDEVSDRLESITGWSLVSVNGLIPTKDFFYMLINKKYPVTISIRKPHQVDFSEDPDIFHDVFGHLPLLTNEKFVNFLTTYSVIALKYINNERAVELLGRLYWYTYEMGILNENGQHKPYGGAIITSSQEVDNMESADVPKHAFDIDKIFRTAYNPYKLQSEYFIIESFDDLFRSLEDLEARLIEHLLLPQRDYVLRNYALNKNIGKDFNNVIGFLNDVQYKFPQAISFVAGQPDETFFNIDEHLSKFEVFVDHMVKKTGKSRTDVVNSIGQYGKTKGIVNDIIAEYLRKDENISVGGESILMTVGAQEAFSVIVSTICNREKDVVLVENPSYIGVSSFAKIFGYHIEGIRIDEEGIDLRALKNRIIDVNRTERKVKLLYVIPDYQNPSGACMPIGNRLKLLELAEQYNFLIIEDSVYNSFTYSQKKNPTLKSLDRSNRVIYVGSFSKSLFPGLRIGIVAADQYVENDMGERVPLIDEMAKVKAQITNNTSGVNQAVLGGVLLDLNCSLSQWSVPKFESYKRKRDFLIQCLNKYIRAYQDDWAQGIDWRNPEGGFFVKITVPFTIDNDSVVESAKNFGVVFCPMRYFYLHADEGENELRITFSNLSLEKIEKGIVQLAEYFKFRSQAVQPESIREKSTLITLNA